jgi:hypothetical protein
MSYQSFLSATKTVGVTDSADGHEKWSSTVAVYGVLASPYAEHDMAELLSYFLVPGQTFASSGANELLDVEAEGWQQLMMDSSDRLSAISDAQLVTESLPNEHGMVGDMWGDALLPSS